MHCRLPFQTRGISSSTVASPGRDTAIHITRFLTDIIIPSCEALLSLAFVVLNAFYDHYSILPVPRVPIVIISTLFGTFSVLYGIGKLILFLLASPFSPDNGNNLESGDLAGISEKLEELLTACRYIRVEKADNPGNYTTSVTGDRVPATGSVSHSEIERTCKSTWNDGVRWGPSHGEVRWPAHLKKPSKTTVQPAPWAPYVPPPAARTGFDYYRPYRVINPDAPPVQPAYSRNEQHVEHITLSETNQHLPTGPLNPPQRQITNTSRNDAHLIAQPIIYQQLPTKPNQSGRLPRLRSPSPTYTRTSPKRLVEYSQTPPNPAERLYSTYSDEESADSRLQAFAFPPDKRPAQSMYSEPSARESISLRRADSRRRRLSSLDLTTQARRRRVDDYDDIWELSLEGDGKMDRAVSPKARSVMADYEGLGWGDYGMWEEQGTTSRKTDVSERLQGKLFAHARL